MATNINLSYTAFSPMVSRIGNDAKFCAVNGQVDFSVDTSFVADLSAKILNGQVTYGMMTLYIDASICTCSFKLTILGSLQSFIINAGSSGYYPLLVTPTTTVIQFSRIPALGTIWQAYEYPLQYAPCPVNFYVINIPFFSHEFRGNDDMETIYMGDGGATAPGQSGILIPPIPGIGITVVGMRWGLTPNAWQSSGAISGYFEVVMGVTPDDPNPPVVLYPTWLFVPGTQFSPLPPPAEYLPSNLKFSLPNSGLYLGYEVAGTLTAGAFNIQVWYKVWDCS